MSKNPRHRGSIYFITLSSAALLVVVVLGLAFLIMQYRRSSRWLNHQDLAVVEAQLGVRHALHFTGQTSNWRNLLENGVWLEDVSNGSGSYTVSGTDPDDGDLTNGGDVELTAQATVLGIARTLRVRAFQSPGEWLPRAVVAGNRLELKNQAKITGDVYGNENISNETNTIIDGDAVCVGALAQATGVTGNVVESAEPVDMPDVDNVLTYYLDKATAIPYQPVFELFRLGPNYNPFGTINTEGIYVINCGNNDVEFRNCRIVGTIILIDAGGNSVLDGSIDWQPAFDYYPMLIVKGTRLDIRSHGTLSELTLVRDLSLPGELGYGTVLNTYNGTLRGLIYATGELYLTNGAMIIGVAIGADRVVMDTQASIVHDSNLPDHQVKEFSPFSLTLMPGTWEEVVP